MSDLVKTPIIKLNPAAAEKTTAEWIPVSKLSDDGVTRKTVRKPYPTGGTGVTVASDGTTSVNIDNSSIKVDTDGNLYSPSANSAPLIMHSKAVSGFELHTATKVSQSSMLPVEKLDGNEEIACSDGYVTVDSMANWVKVSVLATVECPGYADNMYIVPVVVSVNGETRTVNVDTTEEITVVDVAMTLYNSSEESLPIKVYMYKDGSDSDSELVSMTVSYQITYSGV